MDVTGKMRCEKKLWNAESKKLELYADIIESGFNLLAPELFV